MPRSAESHGIEAREAVVVLRCRHCGDTFPHRAGEELLCPSCGSGEVEEAHEPLL